MYAHKSTWVVTYFLNSRAINIFVYRATLNPVKMKASYNNEVTDVNDATSVHPGWGECWYVHLPTQMPLGMLSHLEQSREERIWVCFGMVFGISRWEDAIRVTGIFYYLCTNNKRNMLSVNNMHPIKLSSKSQGRNL